VLEDPLDHAFGGLGSIGVPHDVHGFVDGPVGLE